MKSGCEEEFSVKERGPGTEGAMVGSAGFLTGGSQEIL